MHKTIITVLILILIGITAIVFLKSDNNKGESINSMPLQEIVIGDNSIERSDDSVIENEEVGSDETENNDVSNAILTTSDVSIAERIILPLSGGAPTENVKHTIPIEEIRRGCFRQDCIPSVDDPEFVSVAEANELLPDDTIGIALSYKGVDRFYPFNMLVTREIVNDVVAGDPLLVTYCPLCGTGIVFERKVGGIAQEFGVSGMLWQSNLLMYNRAESIDNRNLWSQVLGEAVVGERSGTKLSIVPSNIMRYIDWNKDNQNGEVLNTGRIGDPYDGDYYGVARSFAPNFDELNSPLDPSAYVFGIEIDGMTKAYPDAELLVGVTEDEFNGETIIIEKESNGAVTIRDENEDIVPMVTGFWFSWVAAYPDTELWRNN